MRSKMGKNKKGLVVAAGVLAVLTVLFGVIGAILVAVTAAPGSNRDDCTYRPAAMPCGLVAAVLTLTTQIVASAAIGCCGCCCGEWLTPESKPKRVLAVLLFILSWVLAIAAVIIFLLAATLVGSRGYFHIYIDNVNCIATGVGIFVVATSLFKILVGLDVAWYVLL